MAAILSIEIVPQAAGERDRAKRALLYKIQQLTIDRVAYNRAP
jgi:hypothetical protein